MRAFSIALVALCCACGPQLSKLFGQNEAPTLSIDRLLPAETQGCVRVINLPRFIDRWNSTEMGALGKDERLQPFWNAQQAEIEKRFADAGWQLNLKADDLLSISTGQAGVAWVAQPQNARRPYAVCLVMDINGKQALAESLLNKVSEELKKKGATSEDSQVAGTAVRQYTLPRLPGETVIRQTFYALTENQLYATDDLTLLSNLINANKSGGHANPLAEDATFKNGFAALTEDLNDFDIEYFVRPIGLAKAVRSISGRPASGQTDILKVLENQGFNKITAAVGRVRFDTEVFDLIHDAFVCTESPLTETVQFLDFPNTASKDVPGWLSSESSSLTSFAWNAKDAFWRIRNVVDEIAGQAGTFDEVIAGIKEDPLGPRIDIRNEVLPYITNQVYLATDTVSPININSRRALVAIQVNDPTNKLQKVLERAMENEPDAMAEDFQNLRIWNVSRVDTDEQSLDLGDDFGQLGTNKPAASNDEEKPLLNNWAITKYEDYLLFASHAEVIKEVIERAKSKDLGSKLDAEKDVAQVIQELSKLNDEDDRCAWRVVRSDRSFEMQYELFRTDQLPQSKSILAVLLDRILRPRNDVKDKNQKVKGDLLPPYSQVRDRLMPLGYVAKTQSNGWTIKTFLLAKSATEAQEKAKQAERSPAVTTR